MIRSRCGNGGPASVTSGIESAAASDTAPRMPAHEIRNVCVNGLRRFRQAKIGTQTMRVTITVPVTRIAHHVSCQPDVPVSLSRMLDSCRPTSANTSALSTNATMFQSASPCNRDCTDVSSGVRHPR